MHIIVHAQFIQYNNYGQDYIYIIYSTALFNIPSAIHQLHIVQMPVNSWHRTILKPTPYDSYIAYHKLVLQREGCGDDRKSTTLKEICTREVNIFNNLTPQKCTAVLICH